jgi:hypothetical protein
MQISPSLQNAFTPTPTAEVSKTSPTISTDTTPQKTDSVNKSAYNYFDLGEDISQYTQIDPVQEKTNQELVSYLSGIMHDTTAEGKKNLKAFDTHLYSSILSIDNMTKEEAKELEANLMAEKYKTSSQQVPLSSIDRPYSVLGIGGEIIRGMNMEEMKDFLGKDFAKNATLDIETIIKNMGVFIVDFNERQKQFPHEMGEPIRTLTLDPTLINDDYHRYTKDESNKLSLERFKKLYSFSDEFSKTDKFQELFDKYNVKLGEKKSEILQSLKPVYEAVGSKAYITSQVVSKGLSKSEAIDYFSNVSKELTDRLSWSGYDKTAVFQDMKDSIKLYDKIVADLKDMWGYGDLDVRA